MSRPFSKDASVTLGSIETAATLELMISASTTTSQSEKSIGFLLGISVTMLLSKFGKSKTSPATASSRSTNADKGSISTQMFSAASAAKYSFSARTTATGSPTKRTFSRARYGLVISAS